MDVLSGTSIGVVWRTMATWYAVREVVVVVVVVVVFGIVSVSVTAGADEAAVKDHVELKHRDLETSTSTAAHCVYQVVPICNDLYQTEMEIEQSGSGNLYCLPLLLRTACTRVYRVELYRLVPTNTIDRAVRICEPLASTSTAAHCVYQVVRSCTELYQSAPNSCRTSWGT
ncbi:hypothetical protein RRG08_013396 [Elysia crispata]|uniref:Uncharacterized protein n=1 Tax=Elysia crispata TaxID=231223 RepID=A0AAE1B6N7_9GAST|nr:hypothetical protein RRG08_013396 [Elysia crispata]